MNDSFIKKEDNIHSYHTNHQKNEFDNEALKYHLLQELPNHLKAYLSNFDIKDIEIIKSVLLKAKKSFNKNNDTIYRLEDIEFEMINVLKRFKSMLIQKEENVKSMQGYLMQSIKAELEETHTLTMRRQNNLQYNLFNR
ncbi:TPA: hypothetical protein PC496_003828 [Clostridioides difficile]|nr:hypothetical protein [Clostridioides difficile]HDF2938090.1 hypothetical protein [Clostridioides difficile]